MQVTTGYYRFLQITTGYNMLLVVLIAHYRLPQVITCYYRLIEVTKCYYRLIQVTLGYYSILQRSTGFYRLLYSTTCYYKWLQVLQFSSRFAFTIYRGCSFKEYLFLSVKIAPYFSSLWLTLTEWYQNVRQVSLETNHGTWLAGGNYLSPSIEFKLFAFHFVANAKQFWN